MARMSILADTIVSLHESAFPPLALGFFGLGTGYLIYGPQEFFGMSLKNRGLSVSTGIWGIWMPGFMQFLAGTYLFIGMVWFDSFREPILYAAALAFTAYGVHWFAIGMGRIFNGDPRPVAFMAIAFTMISALGIVVFFTDNDAPVGGLFIGLTCIYVSDFFASLFVRPATAPDGTPQLPPTEKTPIGELGERALGFFHLGTGLWLMYLTWAVTLNFSAGYTLPV
jgi:hypothetical protein